MSRPQKDKIPCPQCRREQDFTRWASLNVTLDPNEKQRLLDGELTRFACPACGHSADVVYPLLYHDMQRSFMVWMIPSDPNDPAGPAGPPEELPPAMTREMKHHRFRMVRSRNELLDKIYVFDAGLDDRVIELVKVIVRGKLPPEHASDETQILFSGVEDAPDGAKLAFAILGPGGQGGMSVSRDAMLKLIEREFAAPLARPLPGSWPVVDMEYALRLMEAGAEAEERASGGGHPPRTSSKKWWQFWRK